MHIHITLHLIACILIILGVAMVSPKVFKMEGDGLCCAQATKLAWVAILVGVLLEILAVYAMHGARVYHVVAYALVLGSMALISPRVFSCDEGSKHCPMGLGVEPRAWVCATAALILLIVGVFVPPVSAHALHVVAYALFILSLVTLVFKFFEEGRLYMVLSWLCLATGFILQIIAVSLR